MPTPNSTKSKTASLVLERLNDLLPPGTKARFNRFQYYKIERPIGELVRIEINSSGNVFRSFKFILSYNGTVGPFGKIAKLMMLDLQKQLPNNHSKRINASRDIAFLVCGKWMKYSEFMNNHINRLDEHYINNWLKSTDHLTLPPLIPIDHIITPLPPPNPLSCSITDVSFPELPVDIDIDFELHEENMHLLHEPITEWDFMFE